MTMTSAQRDRKYKIQFFLMFYFMFTFIKLFANFVLLSGPMMPFHPLITAMMWGAALAVTMSSSKRKIFHSRTVIFFFVGISLFILWGVFTNISGLSLSSGLMEYREVIALSIFLHMLFMSLRIIELYDLRRKVIGITVFCLGLNLVLAFVMYFNGFNFLGSLGNLFQAGGRYRFAYGYIHFNTMGKACLQFFVWGSVYMAIIKEERAKNKIHGWRYAGISYLIYPIASIILLTTASRASISGLILFWLTYYSLSCYQEAKFMMKAMLITLIISFIMFLAVTVNWTLLWNMFWASRMINYDVAFPQLTERGGWLAGVGFRSYRDLRAIFIMPYLDSFYLLTLLQSGLIGLGIFMTTILSFSFVYFQDVKRMTELQKLSAGILVMMLYYGLVESALFGHGPYDFTNWILVILCMNDKNSDTDKN